MNPIITKYLLQGLNWVKGSFDVTEKGASAKKLTAFAFMFMIVWLHKYANENNVLEFLLTDASMILALLGISTWHQLKNGKESILNNLAQDSTTIIIEEPNPNTNGNPQ